jgi:hypothetical protein
VVTRETDPGDDDREHHEQSSAPAASLSCLQSPQG